MKQELVRINSIDGIEQVGILYAPNIFTNKIVIHVHGLNGNFYENKFLDTLAETYTNKNYAFLTFNNRGKDYISEFQKGETSIIIGGSLERFKDCLLDIEGVILTMKDKRSNLVAEVSQEIMKFFGKKVYDTYIPRNVRLAEAPSHGKPIMLYDIASKGAEAYLTLAEEFLERNKESYKKITKHSKFKLRGSN